jgi:hypothetical protein
VIAYFKRYAIVVAYGSTPSAATTGDGAFVAPCGAMADATPGQLRTSYQAAERL